MLQRRTSIPPTLALLALLSLLPACGSMQPPPPSPQQKSQTMGEMLSAAGFQMVPADTQEKQEKLASELPLQVQYTVGRHGKMHYWMADPYDCKCMYVGGEQAYQRYEKIKLNEQFQAKEDRVAQQEAEAGQIEEMDQQEEMFNPYGGFGYIGPDYYW
ncbi:MAG: hypothetical protein Q7S58_20665 [Candidatus Binatus sp.]|uniref:hypothetical protein n=1 Tax=Candidatus Binatus sp. TaxID=2811406 RepID=UPI0027229617|nr:hypothetical protein [Candidatus Binatus sp.]MDO8434818.1 hypothetical protein [Candidatus Binatus sp.]